MKEENLLGTKVQFLDNFMTICAMEEEMYKDFKNNKGEGTSSPKSDKQ